MPENDDEVEAGMAEVAAKIEAERQERRRKLLDGLTPDLREFFEQMERSEKPTPN